MALTDEGADLWMVKKPSFTLGGGIIMLTAVTEKHKLWKKRKLGDKKRVPSSKKLG